MSFADELAELLNISRDSAYRRMRGETVLSLDEAKKLYDHYGVSIDALMTSSSNMALFHHRAVNTDYSLERWLNSVNKNLELLNSYESKELLYAAKDVPVFHYFRLPLLASFKIFFWLKTMIKDPAFTNKNYHPDVVPKELLAAGEKVWRLYSSVPSTEIWSDEAINETVKQIEFYRECQFFAEQDMATKIYDQLLELILLIKEEAANGEKAGKGAYRFFENEILIGDNTVSARMDKKRVVYINYNNLNLLTTLQESFCEKTEQYLSNLIKNSTLISSTAEKERNKFFNKMKNRVETFRNRSVI